MVREIAMLSKCHTLDGLKKQMFLYAVLLTGIDTEGVINHQRCGNSLVTGNTNLLNRYIRLTFTTK